MTNAPLSKPGSGSVPQYSRTQHKSDRRQARTYDDPRKHRPCLAVARLVVRRTPGRVQHSSAISTGKSIIHLPCSAARLTAQSETERSLSAVVYSLDDTTVGRVADRARNKYVQKLWVRTYVQCRLGRAVHGLPRTRLPDDDAASRNELQTERVRVRLHVVFI